MGKVIVLFVDDEQDFRFLSIRQIKKIFKDQEFEFIEATDGKEALDLLKRGAKPSVIIVDSAMPKINGIELLRRIDLDHHDLYDVPRIMVSGNDSADIKNEAQELRCKFLRKNIDSKIFFRQLCHYLATKLGFSST